jgi:hypothetical protein
MNNNEVQEKKAEVRKIVEATLQRVFGGSIAETLLGALVQDISNVYVKPGDIQ